GEKYGWHAKADMALFSKGKGQTLFSACHGICNVCTQPPRSVFGRDGNRQLHRDKGIQRIRHAVNLAYRHLYFPFSSDVFAKLLDDRHCPKYGARYAVRIVSPVPPSSYFLL